MVLCHHRPPRLFAYKYSSSQLSLHPFSQQNTTHLCQSSCFPVLIFAFPWEYQQEPLTFQPLGVLISLSPHASPIKLGLFYYIEVCSTTRWVFIFLPPTIAHLFLWHQGHDRHTSWLDSNHFTEYPFTEHFFTGHPSTKHFKTPHHQHLKLAPVCLNSV